MGKAHGTHLLSGRIGNLIYKVRNGRQYVSMAPAHSDHERRLKHATKYQAYRLNLQEFAGAAIIGAQIYKDLGYALTGDHAPISAPYTHNLLTAAIKKTVFYKAHETDPDRPILQFHFRDAAKALKDLNLSQKKAPVGEVVFTPMGPQHNPTSIKVTGLQDAAKAISAHGNNRMEFRFRIVQSRFQEIQTEGKGNEWTTFERAKGLPNLNPNQRRFVSRPSGWIPVDILDRTGGGITLPLPERPETEKYITAIIIEWREYRPVGNKLIHHRKEAIVKIVAVHAPAEVFAPKIPHPGKNPYNIAPIFPIVATPKFNWKTDPEGFLADALSQLKT